MASVLPEPLNEVLEPNLTAFINIFGVLRLLGMVIAAKVFEITVLSAEKTVMSLKV